MILEELYFLKANPFALTGAQQPDAPDWFFSDVALEEGKDSTSYSLMACLRGFTERLNKQKAGRRGIIITGNWGSGKTQSLNKIIKETRENFTPLYFNVGELLEEIKRESEATKSLSKAMFRLVFDKLSLSGVGTDAPINLLASELSANRVLLLIDQVEDFTQLGREDDVNEFFRKLGHIVDEAQGKSLSLGIAIGMHTSRYDTVKTRQGRWFLDRFDVAQIREDLSLNEGLDIVKGRLARARTAKFEDKWEGDEGLMKELYPFTVPGIKRVLEFWRMEAPAKTIREFLKMCARTLEWSAENQMKWIQDEQVSNARYRYHQLWEECIAEWKKSKNRHRILVYALYEAFQMAKSACNLIDVVPFPVEEALPEVTVGPRRLDLVVKPMATEGYLAAEVELGGVTSYFKFQFLKKLIDAGEYDGMLIIGINDTILAKAHATAFRAGIQPNKLTVLKIDEDPIRLGRLLSFATLFPDLHFPQDSETRITLSRGIKVSDAEEIVNHVALKSRIDSLIQKSQSIS